MTGGRDWAAFEAALSGVDREALTLAMRLVRLEGPDRCDQIGRMLQERPWAEVAVLAADCCQTEFLALLPHQKSPLDGDVEPLDEGANRLLRRMLALGISRYHPDPKTAIAQAEAQRGDLPPAA